MKTLYDQQIFSFQDYGGVSRYFYELIKGVSKTGDEVSIDGIYSNNIYLPKLKKGTIKVLPNLNFPYKNIFTFYINMFFDSINLKQGNFDLFHATYYHPYFLKYLKGKPYVITVYDMSHEIFSDNVKGFVNKTIKYKRKTICNANKIIAISENTKKDLIKIYGFSDEKIEVIYLGNPLENIKPFPIKNLPDKYVLFVGNRRGYKNFDFFVKSITPILKKNKELFLVCAGGGQFSIEENILLSELKIASKVKQVGFKNDGELAYIYKNALVYVLPSLYEGFGMTALEAFSMGCPVVASNTSSVPEVCGKAAVYIDPKNAKSIKNGVGKIMTDEILRNKFVKLGFEQIKKFSWDKTIADTLKVYEEVLKS